ncbi:HigA family addiction module antitoxin [Vreelandella sp. F11]
MGVSRQSVNKLLRECSAVSPEMALRLARLFGNSPEFWLNAQRSVDL